MPHKQPRRIVVTGASGFIGRALVRHLAQAGNEVLALSRAEVALEGVRSLVLPAYDDVARLTRLVLGADAVVHLAAIAHREATGHEADLQSSFVPNVDVVTAMAQASAAAGVRRFVLLSSIGVNGNHTDGTPFTEEDPPHPAEPYAISKLKCEQALREVVQLYATLDFVILRPPLVYGPQAPGNFGRLAHSVARGAWLPLGAVKNLRSFVGLDNLLSLIELAIDHPGARNQVYVVADGEDVSTPDFVRRIAAALGKPARLPSVPLPVLRLAAWAVGRADWFDRLTASLQVDAGKARRELGWTPPLSLDEGLRRAVARPGTGSHRP